MPLMPLSWQLSILGITLGVCYGLIVWQRRAIERGLVFLGDVKSELRKVTWPNRKEVVGTTMVVLVTVFFFGVFLSVVDVLVTFARNGIFGVAGVGGKG